MPSRDLLFLEGLEVPCRVGCTPEERRLPQSLRVDVKLYCTSLKEAGRLDSLAATVDYRIAFDLIAAVQNQEFLLIERVAEVLAACALTVPVVDEVEVTIRKRPPVQGLEIVGVQIVRGRT